MKDWCTFNETISSQIPVPCLGLIKVTITNLLWNYYKEIKYVYLSTTACAILLSKSVKHL